MTEVTMNEWLVRTHCAGPNCYGNAMAESFFAALKNERVNRTQYPTRTAVRIVN